MPAGDGPPPGDQPPVVAPPSAVPPEPAAAEKFQNSAPFLVVGVGASAGGLEAFSDLVSALPANPNLSILFALHQRPDQESGLADILGRLSPIPVVNPRDETLVQVNHIYVLPPSAGLAAANGRLTLTTMEALRAHQMPIDRLFRALAEMRRGQAVGVVLSGTGTDGTLGLQAIKAAEGITFAQDERSARFDAMPRAAVAEGCVDQVLDPAAIAKELVQLARHSYSNGANVTAGGPVEAFDAFRQIIDLLRQSNRVDFTHYKQATVRRRILRRMALRNLNNVQDYAAAVRAEPDERQALFQDLLIRVTQFFRDPEAFEALRQKVFPALVADRPRDKPIRVWVAGCATGEEVYSIAIALLEYLAAVPEPPMIKILATDLNETALEKARSGIYVDNIELDVSPERLRQFFVRLDGHYQISKAVRELCVFSRHDVTADPPFSRIDLISCRNLLIYLDGPLQRRVLPILHYGLNPDGFLFLGESESVGTFGDLFQLVDVRHRVFVKKATPGTAELDFGPYVQTELAGRRGGRESVTALWNAQDVQREADRIVLARYAPVGVIVDEALTIVQFRGRTSDYLEPAPGMASLDLPRMLREGLLADVRAAIAQAKTENAPVTRPNVGLIENGSDRPVDVEVIPFKIAPAGVRFFLVLFRPVVSDGPPLPPEPAREVAPSASAQLVGQLQQELAAVREYLQAVIEEHESTTEELKSANEEILSANEELQSTNEELQTAKEESQSANEELATVNEELRHRNLELARANNDLVNLLSGVSIPIVMVSRDLRIRRFTPLAERAFNLIPTDVGRPISDIKSNLRVHDLAKLIVAVIENLAPYEAEVQDLQDHWYVLRIRPYVTLDNRIDGASIVLLDVDSIKQRARADGR